MSNVVKIKPDQPLTLEQIARSAVEELDRELRAIGIDPDAQIDDDDEDGEGESSDE